MSLRTDLIFAATSDRRLRGMDLRVLIYLCRDLDDTTPKWVKYQAMAEELGTSRGNVYNSIGRLRDCGYVVRVSRSGLGGTGLWRLPRAPALAQANFHQ